MTTVAGFKNMIQQLAKTNPTPAILQRSTIHSELGKSFFLARLSSWQSMKRIFVSVGIALAASPAMAEPMQFTVGNSHVEVSDGHPSKITIHTVAPMSNEIKILGRNTTTARCEVATKTYYQVIEPPRNGALCFRIEKATAKAGLGQGAKCVGKEAMFWMVYYRPNGPYVRQDTFRYSTIVAHAVVAMNAADITITKSSAPFPEELAAPAPQVAGPVPQCPDPVM